MNLAFNHIVLEALGKKLIHQRQSIAVAESVTTGLLQLALGSVKDASLFYKGGITTYTLRDKCKLLQVDQRHAREVDAVSPQVASEMAVHVSHMFNSDWGVGVTGYSTPSPESEGLVYAWYAIAYRGEIKETEMISPEHDDPQAVQVLYTNAIASKLNAMRPDCHMATIYR